MNYLKIFYLNLSFYVFFTFFSLVSIPFLTLFVVVSSIFITKRRTMRLFRRCIRFYGQIVLRLAFPLIRVFYEEGPQDDGLGPFIFVCNHRSAIDAFLMAYIPQEAVQVVNIWPFRIPVLGRYAKLAEYININAISYEKFLEESLQLLKDGVSIIFFPEGTRSSDGRMGNFRGAAFRLSLQSNVPIVPICISGTERVMSKGSRLLRPGIIKMRMLPGINCRDIKDLSAYSFKNMVRGIIGDELAIMDQVAC